MSFLDKNYLLESDIASDLYQSIKDLPIIDPHNHADIVEIIENDNWDDIWQVEAETDHYVWELMRKRGVSEDNITGDASNYEKWKALAKVFPDFVGNPTYEWVHLDLKRRFGIDKLICEENAEEIWEETKNQLQEDSMKPQSLLKEMNVEVLCTTDDPTTELPYHEQAQEEIDSPDIFPTWRPDDFTNIESDDWKETVAELSKDTGIEIDGLSSLIDALQKTHNYFDEMGCFASDHGIEQPYGYDVSESKVNSIVDKKLDNKSLSKQEVADFKAYMLHQYGQMNKETDWTMQLHIGAVRDYRDKLFETLGPDSGGDISSQDIEFVNNLKDFLNVFDEEVEIVLYCLDPTHLPTITTIARAFPNVSIGAAWWLNDSPFGMEQHLRYCSTVDLFSNFAGMVTDSRKIMSYDSRSEMFRRVLCNVIGNLVKKGQIPEKVAKDFIRYPAYDRKKELFL